MSIHMANRKKRMTLMKFNHSFVQQISTKYPSIALGTENPAVYKSDSISAFKELTYCEQADNVTC